jgi:hypothetical protein
MSTRKAGPKNGEIRTMVEKLHHPLPTPLDNEKDATEEPTATVQFFLLRITWALLVAPHKFALLSF